MELSVKSGLRVKLNLQNKTCSVIESPDATGNVFIPHYIEFENEKYKIISIGTKAFYRNRINYLSFNENSEVQSFEKDCFYSATIKKIQIPLSLRYLKDDWSNSLYGLECIEVSSKNNFFQYFNNSYLLG